MVGEAVKTQIIKQNFNALEHLKPGFLNWTLYFFSNSVPKT